MAGSSIGPFRLERPLGQGGMGIVFLAEHERTGERVALKTVRVARANMLLSIRREIQVLAGLAHPGIVRVVDHGVEDGLPWYAMELLEGVTLRTLMLEGAPPPTGTTDPDPGQGATVAMLPGQPSPGSAATVQNVHEDGAGADPRARRPMPLPEALLMARRLCGPLGYMHGEGVVHRDLKPENVLVRGDGRPVLLDFGLLSQPATRTGRDVLEHAGHVAGTVWYMSPEQASGDSVDARSDLYSLGCILFELTTGTPPFTGDSLVQVIRQQVMAPAPSPTSVVPELPAALDTLMAGLLAKDPARRFGHAEDVAAALEDLGARDPGAGVLPRPRPYLYRSRFAGRQAEMTAMKRRLDQARDGRGALVAIGGGSGVGKTRLAIEVSREAVRRDMDVWTVACGAAAGGGAARPLGALLVAIADLCRDLGADETRALVGARGKVLAAIEPSMGELPGTADAPEPATLPPDAARERMFASLSHVVAEISRRRPHLLVVDDVARADELTMGWLRHLARSEMPRRTPLVVLATYRSEEATPGLMDVVALPGVTRVDLQALQPGAVEEMLGDMLALRPPPAALAALLAERSEGNPFFVAEYLRAALAEGLLDRDTRGRWVARGPGAWEDLPLPRSIDELVARRLAPLPEASRAALEVAACLGSEESWEALASASPLPEGEHLRAVHDLLAQQVLEELPGDRYGFAHDRIREVCAAGLPETARSEIHGRIAAAMDSMAEDARGPSTGALAFHWERAGQAGKARPLYLQAARRAASSYAVDDAERLYGAYLALASTPTPERLAALQELGDKVLRVRGRNREAVDVLERALGEARALGDAPGEAEGLTLLAMAVNRVGDADRATELALRAHALSGEIHDARRQGGAACLLGVIHYIKGRLPEGRRRLEEALALAESSGDGVGAMAALVNLTSLLIHHGLPDAASDAANRVKELARELGDRRGEALGIANLATLEEGRGRLLEATVLFEASLSLFRDVGDRPNEGQTLANLAAVALQAAAPVRAQELAEQALRILHEVGNSRFEGFTRNLLGSALYHQGRRDEALACYERALEAQRGGDNVILYAQVLENIAQLSAERGDLARAERLGEEGIEVCARLGDRRWLGRLRRRLADVRLRQGRPDDALELCGLAVSDLAEMGDARSEADALLFRAGLERDRGDLAAARRDLDRAAALIPEADRLGRVSVTVERGFQAVAAGAPAREHLELASAELTALHVPAESPLWEPLHELAAAERGDAGGGPARG